MVFVCVKKIVYQAAVCIPISNGQLVNMSTKYQRKILT